MKKNIFKFSVLLFIMGFLCSCSFVIITRLMISPMKHSFGNVKIGEKVNFDFILTNILSVVVTLDVVKFTSGTDGTSTEGFSEISGTQGQSIESQATLTIRIRFEPELPAGKKSDTLRIEWHTQDGLTYVSSVKLSGTAKASARIEVNPESYDFGYPKLNTSKSSDFLVNNIGSKDLTITGIEITGEDPQFYTITSGASDDIITPGNSKIITVEFTPTVSGNKRAELRFAHDAENAESPLIIEIQGDGVIPQISAPQSFEFSKTYVGAIRINNLRINSTGSGALVIEEINISGAYASEFTVLKTLPITIPAGTYYNFPVLFEPQSAGIHDSTSVTIRNNTEVDVTVALKGTAAELTPILEEDFEGLSNPQGWTYSGGVWEWGKPVAFTNPFGGATCGADHTTGTGNCIATNLDGPYADDMIINQHFAESPAFNISSTITPLLTFYHWFEIEGLYYGAIVDKGYIKISTDNGVTWRDLNNANNYTYYGEGHSWRKVELDLSFYKSSAVKLRWFFKSDDDRFYAGWYVDDVVVYDSSIWIPDKPSNPSPADNASNISDNGINLTWTANATSYDIYLDTVNPPTEILQTNLTIKRVNTGGLLPATTYYWRVIAKNSTASVLGDVWTFTTR